MLTSEQKKEIMNRAPDFAKPYIKRIFEELPGLEDSVHIEGLAGCWWENEFFSGKRISIDSAIRLYEVKYAEDCRFVKMMTGEEMPPLDSDKWKPQYELNEDLTQAVMESIKDRLDFARKIEEHDGDPVAALLDGLDDLENDRFYGTVVNEVTLKKLDRANSLLDIIKTADNAEVQKFREANPRCNAGIVAIHAVNSYASFQGVVYKAFRELINLADDITIMPRTERVTRIVLSFNDLWKESREMTDEEMAEEEDLDALTDEDVEEMENEIERFNKGEYDYD